MDAQPGETPLGEGGGIFALSRRVRVWPRANDLVLVVCCRTGHGNTHAGAVFRDAAGRWMMFHQAWHKTTRYEPLDDAICDMDALGFSFATVGYPSAITANLLRYCRSIASMPQSIPFAFGIDDEAGWDEETRRLHMPHGKGLTCVNFVMLLFKNAGLVVLDRADWPHRLEDVAFQRQTLSGLERWCIQQSPDKRLTDEDRAHLLAVKAEIDSGCVRIRPEELLGAVLSERVTPTHEDAIPAGVVVSGIVDAAARAAGR